jgi:hypothetical protein
MCTATPFPASDVTADERISEAKTRAQIAPESAPIFDLTTIFRNARLMMPPFETSVPSDTIQPPFIF